MRAVPGLGRPGFLRKRVAGALREAPGGLGTRKPGFLRNSVQCDSSATAQGTCRRSRGNYSENIEEKS